jgi:hypothetical protein
MAVRLGVQLAGLKEITARIGGMQDRAADPQPSLEVVANLLELHVAKTFATEGAHSGNVWPPLAPSTVKARTRRWGYYRHAPTGGAGPSAPILVWRGQLRGSFGRGHPQHVRVVSPSGLIWGSSVAYAIYHQSTRPRSRLPRRPPIAFRDEFQQRELLFQPVRLYLQGVPVGAIETTMRARLSL